ncbi:polyprenyl diphosphate synthase [Chloroflexota bacterium]
MTKASATRDSTPLPNHIAIIMDGNRRWAEQYGLPRLDGHRAGVENMRSTIEYLGKRQLKYLTVYGFSTENWNRPEEEVGGLLRLLEEMIDKEAFELHKKGIRIRHLGRPEGLTSGTQQSIDRAVELTKNNNKMIFNFAFNYGARIEIVDAIRRLIAEGVTPQNIDEELFGSYLYTVGLPDVDLVIRTGGEIRLSNFLMWQTAYSEYYFTKVLWPDFNEKEVDKALLSYSQRKRRFGGD